ncbi:EAL domain-containing protein [Methylocystis sp. B8]|uniref:putative bifunctional diguanylate cyclase/phosphodiesterase n=1 Tax=Methylocystis sp. B8 TaxID=544938 RepID=UPI0010FD77A9|nr:EAL domain-containing protein [Methylocystis sp. B8]TLG79082.1 EAL domain-containing protein [Methylocystis sp. B8]
MCADHTAAQSCSDAEIYADLVETLFDTSETLIMGILAGLLAPMVAWLSTGESVYLVLVLCMSLIGAYRLRLLFMHNRTPVSLRRHQAREWERHYAFGAISFMALLGLSAAILFHQHHNQMIAYYGVIIMTGVTGVLASRNAARPNIVFWQVLGTTMPLAITVLWSFSTWYWGLSAFLVLGSLAVIKTTKFLHGHLESALRNGLDASRQRQKFSLALNSMTHGLCMGDADLSVTVVNRRLIDFFGIVAATTPISLEALAHAIGRSADLSSQESEIFIEQWKRRVAMPHANVFTHKLGERFFEFHCERAEAGSFITVIEDVTIQKRALREIERMAHFDDLTNLPNRYQFQETLEEEMLQLKQSGFHAVLLNIDLDRFKEVNDTLGHSIGDQLLSVVGARLAACVPHPHVVARLGGDEFCVLLRAGNKLPDVDALAATILAEMHRTYIVENHVINIGASIGIAAAPKDSETSGGLLKCSDLALYRSKAGGRGKAIWYSQEMQDALTRKREIDTELRHAFLANELVVYYQPVVDSRTATIVSLEALLRWRHPIRGMISPSEFIPVAEETGMIIEIGAWVLRQACKDAKSWPSNVRVAVNIAPRQFQQKELAELVAETLRDSGLEPDRLELEITETTLMESDDVEGKLREIEALGVRLSLDDFGTGYSSLGYLNRFPVKKVKIDRSFARQAIESPKTQAIVSAISALAQDLSIDLVAEGVETDAQLAFMASKNIFLIQGYLYTRPRPIEELKPLLAYWRDAPRLVSAA